MILCGRFTTGIGHFAVTDSRSVVSTPYLHTISGVNVRRCEWTYLAESDDPIRYTNPTLGAFVMKMRSRAMIATAVTVSGIIAFYGSFYVYNGSAHPCHESLVAEQPAVEFEFDGQPGDAVTITHAGGETITPSTGQALLIEFTDAETGVRDESVWVNESTGSKVGLGDNRTLHEEQLSNASLTKGDQVRVLWQQKENDIPQICPNDTPVETATIGAYTI